MADTQSKVVERGGFEPARRRPVGSTASFLNARADYRSLNQRCATFARPEINW